MSDFETAFANLLKHEGDPGYVNDPKDPGGETKYGISKRANQSVNIKALTKAQAKEIYRTKYWVPAKCDQMQKGISYLVFDASVNHGIRQAALFIQRACGATADGIVGPKTLAAIRSADPVKLIAEFGIQRQTFYYGLSNFSYYGRGWTRRNFETITTALKDISK